MLCLIAAGDGPPVSSSFELARAVGRRIAEIRRARGLTQEELAAEMGTGAKNFQRVEAGQNLTLRSIALLAEKLQVAPDALLRPVGSAVPGVAPSPLQGLSDCVAEVYPQPVPHAVPVLTLEVAAGDWRSQEAPEALAFAVLRGRTKRHPVGAFIARVIGDSMQPLIPRNAWCLFGLVAPGSHVGRVLLVEHRALVDVDTGGAYAVKQIASIKRSGNTRVITLRSLNHRYKDVPIRVHDDTDLKPVAELVRVLVPG